MKNKLLWLIMLMSIMFAFIFIPGTASAKTYGGEFDGATKDKNGNPYTNVWIFDEASATLYVEGYGVLPEMKEGAAPWAAHSGAIEHLIVEDGITTIGKSDFASLSKLKDVSIPKSVTNIEMRAFQNCTSLESITIPGTVKVIGDMSFLGCTSLKTVVFEDGIEKINCNMFNGCKALEDVYVYGMETQISRQRSNQDDGVLFRGCDFEKLTAHCYAGSDAEDYFVNDIYTITNWSSDRYTGEETTQSYAKKPNYMVAGGYTLKVEYITK